MLPNREILVALKVKGGARERCWARMRSDERDPIRLRCRPTGEIEQCGRYREEWR